MHTFEGKSCRIHHNSDMSGEVHICDKNFDKELKVEAQDILDFVAEYIRTLVSKKFAPLRSQGIPVGS